ncbi:MAG: acyl-CoA thioesterase [Saprospiraceae bacterium]|nr:acyl-CoA thioesterase [Candidatus Brachybacter algidus]MBK8747135.1 acyl-CoA thioesterase [Candidatus Brachybacter algidus]
MTEIKPRTPSYSETIKTEIVCPNDTNPVGILMGGRLWNGWMSRRQFAPKSTLEQVCVTAMINKVAFRKPAKIGDVITIKASITRAFRTSMEIKVTAAARNYLSGNQYHVSDAYFTFVALNKDGKTTEVPGVLPETDSELNEYEQALVRKNSNI